MDIINGGFSSINGSLTESSPQEMVQRLSWVTTGETGYGYALTNGISTTGVTSTPQDPAVTLSDLLSSMVSMWFSTPCPGVYMYAGSPFTVHVDWGDGTSEDFESIHRGYSLVTYLDADGNMVQQNSRTSNNNYMFRIAPHTDESMLEVAYISSAVRSINGVRCLPVTRWLDSDGSVIKAIPNHKYEDNEQHNVLVTITSDTQIRYLGFGYMPQFGFPTIEMPYLRTLYLSCLYNRQSTLPWSLFTYLENLTVLDLSNALSSDYKLTSLPDSLFNMENLTQLVMYNLLPNTSGHDWWEELDLHRFSKLKSLTVLNMRNFYLYYYPEELQNLSLTSVQFGTNDRYSTYPLGYPDYSEVKQFTAASGTISFTDDNSGDCQRRTSTPYRDYWAYTDADVSQISTQWADFGTYDYEYPEIPEVFDKFYASTSPFTGRRGYGLTLTDSLVERIYEKTILHPMASTEDGHRNHWYSLSFSFNYSAYNNKRPSGTLQAPEGFVEGSENGNPASPLEMIYVLTHNYGLTWNIIAETSTTSTLNINPLSVDLKVNDIPSNKWVLALNIEGNYIIVAPGTLLVGKLTNLLQFNDETLMQEYINENNITVINSLDEE